MLPSNFPAELPFKVVENKRLKYLRMTFDVQGTLVLKKPKGVKIKDCSAFITRNMDWILRCFNALQKRERLIEEQFYIFGEWVDFAIAESHYMEFLQNKCAKHNVKSLQELWIGAVQCGIPKHKKCLGELYKTALKKYVDVRLQQIIHMMQLTPISVVYGKSYRQLGCCYHNSKKIRFSVRLSLMPKHCIDSVIIHELAHLKYHNHSRAFWNLVKCYDDNPKVVQQWLETHQENGQIYFKVFKY